MKIVKDNEQKRIKKENKQKNKFKNIIINK